MTRREALKTTFFSALLVAIGGLPAAIPAGEQHQTGITIKMDTALLRQGDVIMNADSEQFMILRKDGKWQAVGLKTHMVIDIEHVVEETENELHVPKWDFRNEGPLKPYVLVCTAYAEGSGQPFDGKNYSWQKADERGQFSHYEDDGDIKVIQI